MSEISKKIEIITGDGTNLNISQVSTHISSLKPKNKGNSKQEIVIPEVKKKNENKK